jgi:hypothetical protein
MDIAHDIAIKAEPGPQCQFGLSSRKLVGGYLALLFVWVSRVLGITASRVSTVQA